MLHGLDRALKNMDNIKETYTELSALHSEKLHVDPDNFKVRFHPPAKTKKPSHFVVGSHTHEL